MDNESKQPINKHVYHNLTHELSKYIQKWPRV